MGKQLSQRMAIQSCREGLTLRIMVRGRFQSFNDIFVHSKEPTVRTAY